ncbi:PspA-associated protein PspAB [Streptomyces europaeiscabiei]|uniref:PspA-associated protein PspAB n=1 Tax=Streptomyces europaeiscabiei TaxID=146819 RepID=UPI0038F7A207
MRGGTHRPDRVRQLPVVVLSPAEPKAVRGSADPGGVSAPTRERGTFCPFAPLPGVERRRDNALEPRVRAVLGDEPRIEPALRRRFPIRGAPGL